MNFLGIVMCGLVFAIGASPAAATDTKLPTNSSQKRSPKPLPVDAHFDLSRLKPGMRGTCHTVFEGGAEDVEPFDFLVKGLMPNHLGPGEDLVLVKLLGEKTLFTGVVSGMSGSPCYINGRLLGALGYAFGNFSKEPIGGITPIASMLKALRLKNDLFWASSSLNKSVFKKSKESKNNQLNFAYAKRNAETIEGFSDLGGARPIATPLVLAGISPRVQAMFSDVFDELKDRHGWVSVAGGGSRSAKRRSKGATNKSLAPGDPIAAVMMRGDVDMAGTGTVTWVKNGEVLAFGHPFMGHGPVSIPMAQARILHTLSSHQRSYKMSVTGDVVGTLFQDRLSAIVGRLGTAPKMLPVSIDFTSSDGKARTFSFEVVRDLEMTPRLVAMGIASCLTGQVDGTTHGTLTMESLINVEGVAPVEIAGRYSGDRDYSLMYGGAIDVAHAISEFWQQDFTRPPIVKVHVKAHLDATPKVISVKALYLGQENIYPGDLVEIAVELKAARKKPFRELFSFMIPTLWAGKEVEFIAGDVDMMNSLDFSVQYDVGEQHRLDGIRNWVANWRQSGDLFIVARLSGESHGLIIEGRRTAPLPPSLSLLLESPNTPKSSGKRIAWEQYRRLDAVVMGGAMQKLNVLRK